MSEGSDDPKDLRNMGNRGRARSVPSKQPFLVAVFFTSLYFLGVIATVSSFTLVVARPSKLAMQVFVGSLAVCAVLWLVAFFKRRSAICPLCKGTPLCNSGARVHGRAVRLFPLNQGMTATLSILATQRFRCMYCGSDYDLLKTPASRRNQRDSYRD